MMMRLAQGSAWVLCARLIARGIDFATLLLLARALRPADFGTVALAMIAISVVDAALQLPVYQALVRLPDPSREDFDTAFTLSLLRGIILLLIVAASSLPIAHLFGDEHLIALILVLGLAPFFRGITSPALASYQKQMIFIPSFLMDVGGKIAAFILTLGILAVRHDYWAIAASTILGPAMTSSLSFVVAPYRPRLRIDRWHVFAAYVRWGTASQIVSAVNWQCDRLLMGLFMTKSQVGTFAMAADLSAIPGQTMLAPLFEPMTAAVASLGSDMKRLKNLLTQVTEWIVVLGIPLFVGLSAASTPLFEVLLDPKWKDAEPTFRWLALETIPYLLTVPLVPLLIMCDRMHLMLKRNTIELFLKLPLVALGAAFFGTLGVVAARLFMAIVVNIVAICLVRDMTAISVKSQILHHWRPAISGGFMYLAMVGTMDIALAKGCSSFSVLVAGTFAGSLTYVAVMAALGFRPESLLHSGEVTRSSSLASS